MQHTLQNHVDTISALKTNIAQTISGYYGLPFDGSPVQVEIYMALYYYWELKKKRISRTLQIIRDRGIVQAVDELVSRLTDSYGFTSFSNDGLLDRTFEHVVMCFPECFSDTARIQAIKRMI